MGSANHCDDVILPQIDISKHKRSVVPIDQLAQYREQSAASRNSSNLSLRQKLSSSGGSTQKKIKIKGIVD